MRKFRVAFHKIPAGWEGLWYGLRHPVSGGIALVTLSRYTHVEIWTPSIINGRWKRYGEYVRNCYTSTLRGKYDGACKRPASEVFKNPERWDYFEYECEDKDFDKMVAAMEEAVKENKGYDKELIAWWWHKAKRVYDKAKYICTEFGSMSLIAVEVISWKFMGAVLRMPVYQLHLEEEPLTPKAFVKVLPGEIRPLIKEMK